LFLPFSHGSPLNFAEDPGRSYHKAN
jgi:hypothetical protein